MPFSRWSTPALVGTLLTCLPGPAVAHTPIEGIGAFYNGMLHPVLVPAHLMSVIAVGLVIGQQRSDLLQPAALTFLAATGAGLVSAGLGLAAAFELPLLAAAACCGLLVAWRPRLSLAIGIVLGGLIGYAVGLDSRPATVDPQGRIAALLGSGITLYLLFLYGAAAAERLNARPWQQVAVRVVGSWIAASALMVLSLSFVALNGPG